MLFEHQQKLSAEIQRVLREYAVCYVSAQERVGKTLAIIDAAHKINVDALVVVTTLKAKGEDESKGWLAAVKMYNGSKPIFVVNYHSAHKLDLSKVPPNYLVCLDESHKYIGGFPKRSTICKNLDRICKFKPIVYASATPNPQTRASLYHQFSLSTWSPFAKYKSFYAWHADYGIPMSFFMAGRVIKQYHETKDFLPEIKHLFVSMTRKEAGFKFEPEDKVHYVSMPVELMQLCKKLLDTSVVEIEDKNGKTWTVIADTVGSPQRKVHQICGGTLKLTNEDNESFAIELKHKAKVEYIKNNIPADSLVIMHYYVAEGEMLRREFPNATIGQIERYAEGTDFSMYDHLVVYSMDYKASTYWQIRARQANYFRDSPITVHFLLTEYQIDHHIYNVVQSKKDFTSIYYQEVYNDIAAHS